MEAVRSNRSHRPGSSLNKVGPSQLMWAHSQIMWAQNGDDLDPTADSLRSLHLHVSGFRLNPKVDCNQEGFSSGVEKQIKAY